MATLNNSQNNNLISFVAVVTHFIQKEKKERNYYLINLIKKDGSTILAYAWEDEYQGVYLKQPTEAIVQGVKRQLSGQERFQVLFLSKNLNDISALNKSVSWPIPVDSLNVSGNLKVP